MHFLYFDCLATNLFDCFYKHTTLCCYGNHVGEGYPIKCIVIYSLLLLSIHEHRSKFTLIVFDYLILTFKVKRSGKIPDISCELDF